MVGFLASLFGGRSATPEPSPAPPPALAEKKPRRAAIVAVASADPRIRSAPGRPSPTRRLRPTTSCAGLWRGEGGGRQDHADAETPAPLAGRGAALGCRAASAAPSQRIRCRGGEPSACRCRRLGRSISPSLDGGMANLSAARGTSAVGSRRLSRALGPAASCLRTPTPRRSCAPCSMRWAPARWRSLRAETRRCGSQSRACGELRRTQSLLSLPIRCRRASAPGAPATI